MGAYPETIGWSPEAKMRRLFSFLNSTLRLSAQIDVGTGAPLDTEPLEVTVAGLYNGHIKIMRCDLVLKQDQGSVEYEERNYPTIEVQTRLIPVIRGIDTVANEVLANPAVHPDDRILQRYSAAMKANNGASLTLDDLKQIGEQLERYTVQRYGKWVGGGRQVALIDNAGARIVEAPQSFDIKEEDRPLFVLYEGVRIGNIHAAFHVFDSIVAMYPAGAMITKGDFAFASQPLDNLFFFTSSFDRCLLSYSGRGPFIVDPSTHIKRSVLVLFKGANPQSEDVLNFKASFPDVKLIDKTDTIKSVQQIEQLESVLPE